MGAVIAALWPQEEKTIWQELGQYHFYRESVEFSKLPGMYDEFITVFGRDIAPRSALEQWLQKNDKLIWRVYKCESPSENDDAEAIGFYELIPITAVP